MTNDPDFLLSKYKNGKLTNYIIKQKTDSGKTIVVGGYSDSNLIEVFQFKYLPACSKIAEIQLDTNDQLANFVIGRGIGPN